MPRYTVRTLATIERHYSVEADNPKAAIEASTVSSPVSEEEIEEETTGVYIEGRKVDVSKAKLAASSDQ